MLRRGGLWGKSLPLKNKEPSQVGPHSLKANVRFSPSFSSVSWYSLDILFSFGSLLIISECWPTAFKSIESKDALFLKQNKTKHKLDQLQWEVCAFSLVVNPCTSLLLAFVLCPLTLRFLKGLGEHLIQVHYFTGKEILTFYGEHRWRALTKIIILLFALKILSTS